MVKHILKGENMETKNALKIIEALADGVDPFSGEVFADESLYQQPEIIRAMFTAKESLETTLKREIRKRALPERAGKPWDEQENSRLMKNYEQGIPIKELAVAHKRTNRAIISQLVKNGKLLD